MEKLKMASTVRESRAAYCRCLAVLTLAVTRGLEFGWLSYRSQCEVAFWWALRSPVLSCHSFIIFGFSSEAILLASPSVLAFRTETRTSGFIRNCHSALLALCDNVSGRLFFFWKREFVCNFIYLFDSLFVCFWWWCLPEQPNQNASRIGSKIHSMESNLRADVLFR